MRKCKVNTQVYSVADKLIDDICHLPGGYLFWQALPDKGRKNKGSVRGRIASRIWTDVFTDRFMCILLTTALDEQGLPRSELPLYSWLLQYMYSNDIRSMYDDWLSLRRVNGGKREG